MTLEFFQIESLYDRLMEAFGPTVATAEEARRLRVIETARGLYGILCDSEGEVRSFEHCIEVASGIEATAEKYLKDGEV